LILYGAYARMMRGEGYPWGYSEEMVPAIEAYIENEWGSPWGLSMFAPSMVGDQAFADWLAKYMRLAASPGEALALNRMARTIDLRQTLSSVCIPTLVLHRRDDRAVRVDHGRYLAEHIPGAKYVELPGQDHLEYVGDTDAMVDEVEEFLTGVRPSAKLDRVLDPVACAEPAGVESLFRREGALALDEAQGIAETLGMDGLRRKLTGLSSTTALRALPDDAVFRCDGDFWTVAWQGKLVRLKDSKGVQCLAHLLRHQGREILALDLIVHLSGSDSLPDGQVGASERGRRQRPAEGDLGPILDAEARRAYRTRLADLRDELDEASRCNDLGRAEALRAEMEMVTAQLRSAVGLGGRDRAPGSAAERARLTVSKRIRAALKRIGELHPQLGHYLNACVKTGHYCSYTPPPDEVARWILSLLAIVYSWGSVVLESVPSLA